MKVETYPPIYIMEFNTGSTETDTKAFCGAFGYSPKVVQGCYKGVVSDSYIVPCNTATRQHVLSIAREYDQESVLYLDQYRGGYLLYTDGREDEYVGLWANVTESHAKSLDAYTRDGNKYYSCV